MSEGVTPSPEGTHSGFPSHTHNLLGGLTVTVLGLAPAMALLTFAAIGVMRWPLHWSLAVLVPLSIAVAWVRR